MLLDHLGSRELASEPHPGNIFQKPMFLALETFNLTTSRRFSRILVIICTDGVRIDTLPVLSLSDKTDCCCDNTILTGNVLPQGTWSDLPSSGSYWHNPGPPAWTMRNC